MNNKEVKTVEQKEKELREIGFFVGGLTDEGIIYYYNQMANQGKIVSNNQINKK